MDYAARFQRWKAGILAAGRADVDELRAAAAWALEHPAGTLVLGPGAKERTA
jgi:hypothetical protein